MLFVSIIGGACPAAIAALYAACVGYRGGGGSTLSQGLISRRTIEQRVLFRDRATYNMVAQILYVPARLVKVRFVSVIDTDLVVSFEEYEG